MTSAGASSRTWLLVGGAAIIAAAAGFGVAKLSSPPAPTVAGPDTEQAEPQSVVTLEVPADHISAAGIVVEAVAPGSLSVEILAPARITAAPKGQAVVTAIAAGKVTRLPKQLGDAVRAGEVLAVVESREAATMAADRSVANAKVAQARNVAAREQELFDKRVSARQDLEAGQAALAVAEAEARRANAAAGSAHVSDDGRSALIVSPINGRITAQTVSLGAFVQPETQLFELADPALVQIEAFITAADAGRVAIGDQATISTPSGQSLKAVVRSVTPTLDPVTRSATVVLALSGNPKQLSPGTAVEARITPKSGSPGGIVIPDEAIQSVGGRDVVFVRSENGFVVQPVIVSSRSGGRASILSGITDNQSIATRNAFLLKAQLGTGGDEE